MIYEKRLSPIDMRQRGRKLEGYAATFGTEGWIDNSYVEIIAPGAFRQSLASSEDILALADHDHTKILGRTSSRTLRLSEDSHGLAFEIDLPETTLGRDILALAERGDLGGMSFGFLPIQEDRIAGKRVLNAVQLIEISVVSAWPAYNNTSVNARSKLTKSRARVQLEMLQHLPPPSSRLPFRPKPKRS